MANLRAIRERIKSVDNTRQITKSMKMVAVSKLRRTQSSMLSLRPFAEKCGEVLSAAASDGVGASPFFSDKKETGKVCYVLFVGNRGLCGAYNLSVLHYLEELLKEDKREKSLVVCGRWGKDLISGIGTEIIRTFDEIGDAPGAGEGKQLSDYLLELYLKGEADEVVLVYEHYDSALTQTPTSKVLFPVTRPEGSAKRDYIFEPDRASLIESAVNLYIDSTVYSVLLEAKTGEHASRMTAMTSASDNTDELIAELQLQLNHARQAAITTEISEISGGAAALSQ